ncbi:MAG: flagellar export chaperone FliS [Acidobacteriota bacterium]|nr:flagellar export chaperone FliS [Acidobacteriota bacterium]
MSQGSYERDSLAGATGVELVLALYDAAIRFLYRAAQCAQEDDVRGRRMAVKKFIDIIMYLQARLRPDVGGSVAAALSEFYNAMFTMVLEASHHASVEEFHKVIACVKNVRDAWLVVARDPAAGKVLPRELRTREELFMPLAASAPAHVELDCEVSSRWMA